MGLKKLSVRSWGLIGALALLGTVILVPAVSIVSYLLESGIGRTSVEEDIDGSKKTIYWRDYPSTAELNPQDILDGPTPEEGFETSEVMIKEIKSALSDDFSMQWDDPRARSAEEMFFPQASNDYGGRSLLTTINAPEHHSTSVPESWADKQRAISIIGEISSRYGYETPQLDTDNWSESELVENQGSTDPASWVEVHGMANGPTGQWLMFGFIDYSKDTTGKIAQENAEFSGENGTQSSLFISYGANGLLPESNRGAFKKALEPYLGLELPEPVES